MDMQFEIFQKVASKMNITTSEAFDIFVQGRIAEATIAWQLAILSALALVTTFIATFLVRYFTCKDEFMRLESSLVCSGVITGLLLMVIMVTGYFTYNYLLTMTAPEYVTIIKLIKLMTGKGG